MGTRLRSRTGGTRPAQSATIRSWAVTTSCIGWTCSKCAAGAPPPTGAITRSANSARPRNAGPPAHLLTSDTHQGNVLDIKMSVLLNGTVKVRFPWQSGWPARGDRNLSGRSTGRDAGPQETAARAPPDSSGPSAHHVCGAHQVHNYGPPASLLNAISYVYREWLYKQAGFASCRRCGGGPALGAGAQAGPDGPEGDAGPGSAADPVPLPATSWAGGSMPCR